MKFDSNLAWKEASSAVAANREVLLALAGVFFILPSLAFALLMPTPEPQPGATAEQAMRVAQAYYLQAFPYALPVMILQGVGTLALLALFTDRRRPTVGEAIKLGFIGLLTYLAAQLLMGLGLGLVFGLLGGIAVASGAKALVAVVIVAAVLGFLYVTIKTSLMAAVIMVEGVRNPVTALTRSWRLTKGNSARLGLFYLLLGVVFVVVISIITAIVGLLTTMLLGGETAKVIDAVVSSALTAVMTLYFVAIIAAAHRQLAGPSPERISETFE